MRFIRHALGLERWLISGFFFLIALSTALAQQPQLELPPLPPGARQPVPGLGPAPQTKPLAQSRASQGKLGTPTNSLLNPPVFTNSLFRPPVMVSPVPAKPAPLNADANLKEYAAKPGETNAHFIFNLTNVSSAPVLINFVRTSCGCTVAKLPSTPWKLEPGSNGPIQVTVDLRGKLGTI